VSRIRFPEGRWANVPILAVLLFVSLSVAGSTTQNVHAATLSTLAQNATSPSWNPATSCKAVVLTTEQFLGKVPNPTQIQPNVGADYSGGALPLVGAKPAGTNPPSWQWPYPKRSTSPPCTVTLSNGTVLPTLVEIHSLLVVEVWLDECGSVLPGQCDQVFNVCNAMLASNCGATYPDSMHRVHSEIDMYWNQSGIAPPRPTSRTTIDIQGFVFWDDYHLKDSWHQFSGWELHPVSAWRISGQSPPPDFGMTASPRSITVSAGSSGTSSIALTSLNNYVGTVSLTSSITSSSISVVQPTVSLSPTSISLPSSGTGLSTLTVSTSLLTTPGIYTVSVRGTSGSMSHYTTVTVTVTLP